METPVGAAPVQPLVRCVPRADPAEEGLGWVVAYDFLKTLQTRIRARAESESLGLEEIEAVVIALIAMGYAS